MNTALIIALIIGALVAFSALWFVGAYNKLVKLQALVHEGWSNIDVQLKRRYDLVPNLVETVKGYAGHERTTLENVIQARNAAINAQGVAQKSQAESELTQALRSLFVLVEAYPDLKANQNFLELQRNLNGIEQDIQLARRYYNGTARTYNTSVASFPTSVIANMTGFKPVSYFELTAASEREAPRVQF